MSGRFGGEHEAAEQVPNPPQEPVEGSEPLRKSKHEKFVREIVKGANATAAYKAAGFKAKGESATAAASRLLGNVNIIARLNFLQAKITAGVAQSKIMDGQEVLEKLSNMARTNMRHFFKVGPDGDPLLDFSTLTEEQTESMQEITVEEFKDGRSDKREVRRVKFKLADKKGALEILAKHHGLLTEKHEHKHEHQHVLVTLLAELDNGAAGKVIDGVAQDVPAGKVIEHQG